MSTQNQEKKSLGSDRFQSLSRKAGKASSQAVVEQVPPWLKQLLTKYKERGGPLVGLEQGGIGQQEELLGPIPPAPTSTEAGLSALLEQMAEEGLPESSSDQLATSVEWGAYNKSADLSSPSLDDLLANMTVGPDDPYQIASPSYSQPTTFPTIEQETEALDWITDMVPGASVTQSEQNYGRPTSPPQTETPDWLAEALEESPTSTSIPPVSPSPSLSPSPAPPASHVDNVDIPDWLDEALSNPSATSVDVPPPTVSDQNIPDWLTTPTSETSPETSFYPETSDYTASGKATPSVDIPDWLNNIVPPSDVPEDRSKQARVTSIEVEENEPAIAIPDWLADMALPATDEIEPFAPPTTQTETPDWITEGITDQTETEEKYPEGRPDWFTQEQSVDQTAADSEDWLAPLADPSPPATSEATTSFTSDDWLTDFLNTSSPGEAFTPPVKKEAPLPAAADDDDDWLADFGVGLADQEGDLPAWLTETETTSPFLTSQEEQQEPKSEVESVSKLKKLRPSPSTTPSSQPPEATEAIDESLPWLNETSGIEKGEDWRSELLQSVADTPSESAETSDWFLSETSAEEDELLARRLDWFTSSSEVAPPKIELEQQKDTPAEELEVPDWLFDLPEISPIESALLSSTSMEQTEIEGKQTAPDWLTELPVEDLETPDWLTNLADEEPETPATWPADLPEAPTSEEAGLSSTSVTEEEEDISFWLTDLSEIIINEETVAPPISIQPTEVEEDLETPTWLAEFPDVASTEEPLTHPPAQVDTVKVEEEPEMPPWLGDLPETSATEELSTPSSSLSTEEFEEPSWLADLQEVSPSEEISSTLASTAIEKDTEGLSWLGNLSRAPVSEQSFTTSTSSGVEELEIPSWLADLQEEPIRSAPAEVPQVEAELEILPWLADLPEVAGTVETTSTPVAAVDEEQEVPSWLAELSEVTGTVETTSEPVAAIDEEQEVPPWLSELSEVTDTIETTPAPVSAIDEVEAETPAWLAELPEVSAIEMDTAGSTPATAEVEAETPAWLADLPEPATAEEEVQSPAWLTSPADLTTAEEAPSALADTSEIEEELEIPPWLASLRKESAPEEVSPPATLTEMQAIDEEQEVPPWLSELSEVTDTIETTPAPVSAIDEELEIPPWLAELPEVSASEMDTAGSTPATAEVEAETPAWLADLPEPATAEEEVQPPAWLTSPTDLTTIEEAPSALADTSEIEEELEIPPWLADLRKGSAPEEVSTPTTLTEMQAIDEEQEVPPWLSELSEVTDTVETTPTSVSATDEAEAETPAWLADLPELATAEEEVQSPAWLTSPADLTTAEEAPSALADTSEIEEELEIPPWLASLRKESAPEEVSPPATLTEMQAIDEVEAETPAWLAELPEPTTAEEEAQSPAWLTSPTDLTTAEEAPSALADTSEIEEELEIPPWLASLRKESAPEEVSPPATLTEMQAIDEEQEVPPWLSELSEVTDTVETTPAPVSAIDEELEIPPWLASLRKESAPEEVSPPAISTEMQAIDEVEAETPAWLAELPEPTTAEEEAQPPAWLTSPTDLTTIEEVSPALADTSEIEEELEIPPWLASLRKESAPEEVSPPAISTEMSAGDEEPEAPSWLAELPEVTDTVETTPAPVSATVEVEAETPAWLAGSSEVTTEETSSTEIETPPWLVDATETSPVEALEDKVTRGEEEAETSEWLADLAQVTEAELPPEPGWLADLEETQVDEVASPEAEAEISSTLLFEQEPAAPDWLLDSTEPSETPADLRGSAASPAEISQLDSSSTTVSDGKPSRPVSSSSGLTLPDWLRTLQPPDEGVEAEDHKSVEATGVLAGLTGLLPAEKVVTATSDLEAHASLLGDQAGALRVAARDFYTIATQAPQPLMISAPLTQRDRVMANAVRAALYLLFIILVALPLIPNFQKTVDPVTGTKGPWTEPAGALSEVLDNQRRELISTQLGIIDLQQPGSIALVSFDYATATQGEMEPLAEAVIGRLRGQGMRVIAVSLEPEGAVLAQGMLDKIVTERNEKYGADIVNLGYLPGQVAAIRELVSGRAQLFQMTDFQNGLTFEAPERASWQEVKNLEQIDVVVTLADNPATVRWWVEQMAVAAQPVDGERYLLAATSAVAEPFLQPYRASDQLDGLISGINGAAAIEAGRQNFGSARQMLDSQSIAHLLIVILIAVGTMVGWMPSGDHLSGSASGPKSKKVTKMKEAG